MVRSDMRRKLLYDRRAVAAVLCLLTVALIALPRASYSLNTQEWWLPAFLTVLSGIALIQLLLRRTHANWPWYLLTFAQGFNIISRLMMLLPRVTTSVGGIERFNAEAVVVFVASIVLSAYGVGYVERPEVRAALAR
jgi:hypothetical protein